jgi:hypothetical protein
MVTTCDRKIYVKTPTAVCSSGATGVAGGTPAAVHGLLGVSGGGVVGWVVSRRRRGKPEEHIADRTGGPLAVPKSPEPCAVSPSPICRSDRPRACMSPMIGANFAASACACSLLASAPSRRSILGPPENGGFVGCYFCSCGLGFMAGRIGRKHAQGAPGESAEDASRPPRQCPRQCHQWPPEGLPDAWPNPRQPTLLRPPGSLGAGG